MDLLDSEIDFSDEPVDDTSDHHLMPHNQERLLLIALNFSILTALIYTTLLALKLDAVLPEQLMWSYLSIPSGISLFLLGTSALYVIHTQGNKILNPGRFILQTVVILFCASFISFFVLLNLKLDKAIKVPFGGVFTPLFVILALTTYVLCFLFPAVMEKKSGNLKQATLMVMDFILVGLFVIVLCLKLDHKIGWSLQKVFSFLFALIVVHCIFMAVEAKDKSLKRIFQEALALFSILFVCIFVLLCINGIVNLSWFVPLTPALLSLAALQYITVKNLWNSVNVKQK